MNVLLIEKRRWIAQVTGMCKHGFPVEEYLFPGVAVDTCACYNHCCRYQTLLPPRSSKRFIEAKHPQRMRQQEAFVFCEDKRWSKERESY